MAYMSNGRILRHDYTSRYSFDFRRVSLLSCIFTVLYITNPANDIPPWMNITLRTNSTSKDRIPDQNRHHHRPKRKKLGSFSFDILGIEIDLFESSSSTVAKPFPWNHYPHSRDRRLTNFALFSLEKRGVGNDEVRVHVLNQNFRLCYNDSDDVKSQICDWIADNLCHGMKAFTPRNRPFTAHRLFIYLVTLSIFLSICITTYAPPPVASMYNLRHKPLTLPLSIFYQPSLEDFVLFNALTYKPLQLLDKVVSLAASDSHIASVHFWCCFGVLILIGGVCNVMSSLFVDRSLKGMKSVISILMGYQLAIAPSKAILEVAGVQFVASDVLMLFGIGWGMQILFSVGKREGGSVLAWILGGVAGKVLGSYQVERYGLWWSLW